MPSLLCRFQKNFLPFWANVPSHLATAAAEWALRCQSEFLSLPDVIEAWWVVWENLSSFYLVECCRPPIARFRDAWIFFNFTIAPNCPTQLWAVIPSYPGSWCRWLSSASFNLFHSCNRRSQSGNNFAKSIPPHRAKLHWDNHTKRF